MNKQHKCGCSLLAEYRCHFDLFRTEAFMFHTHLGDFHSPLGYLEEKCIYKWKMFISN